MIMVESSPELSPEKPWFSNLRPMPPWNSETAREAGRKGGKVMSERKAVANSLKNRIWCEPKCPIYSSCPFPKMSHIQYEGKCALKRQEAKIQGMIVGLLLDENKTLEVIEQLLAEMAIGSLGDFKKQAILVDKLLNLYKLEHWIKSKSQAEIEKRDYKFVVEVKEPKVLQEKKDDKKDS